MQEKRIPGQEKDLTATEVVAAIGQKRLVAPRAGSTYFTLIAYHRWSEHDVPALERILGYLTKTYRLRFTICGGGFACSRLDIEIQTDDPTKALSALKAIMNDEEALAHFGEVGARVLIAGPINARKNLLSNETDFSPSSLISIGKVEHLELNQIKAGGNISQANAAGNDLANPQLVIDPKNYDRLFDLMIIELNRLTLAEAERRRTLNDISFVRNELKAEAPRKEIVKPMLDVMAKLASIGSLVINVQRALGYIP